MQINADLSSTAPVLPKKKSHKEMLTLSELSDGRIKVKINSSSLSIIQECLRKAKFSLYDQWVAQNESPATLFGTGIHKALEVFYLGMLKDRKLPTNLTEKAELIGHGNTYEGDSLPLRAIQAFVDATKPLEQLPPGNKRSIPTGAWILAQYFRTYIEDPYIVYSDESGPMVERTFSTVLHDGDDLQIEYFGTIDVVLKHIHSGRILVTDHKTSSIIGNDFYNRLKPNHQYTGYLWGAKRALGIDSDQFMVNCLQVKEKPKTSRGTGPNFLRQVTDRTESDYVDFQDSVIDSVNRYINSDLLKVWPQGHVNACAMYGGCTFIQVCSSPPELRESILKAKFIQKEGQNGQ